MKELIETIKEYGGEMLRLVAIVAIFYAVIKVLQWLANLTAA